jgi:hypothetical protein
MKTFLKKKEIKLIIEKRSNALIDPCRTASCWVILKEVLFLCKNLHGYIINSHNESFLI